VAFINLAACASDDSFVAACGADIELLANVAPVIRGVHNSFEGYAIVDFDLSKDGTVQEPRIVSSEWNPIGRARGEPDNYEEAVLSAALQWRFAPQEYPCRGTRRVTFRFEG
jgi:TonB family protein